MIKKIIVFLCSLFAIIAVTMSTPAAAVVQPPHLNYNVKLNVVGFPGLYDPFAAQLLLVAERPATNTYLILEAYGQIQGEDVLGLANFAFADQGLFGMPNALLPSFPGFSVSTATKNYNFYFDPDGVFGSSAYFIESLTSPEGLPLFGLPVYIESSIPEPGTWAMLVVGFGLAGVVMRRRKTLAHAVA